MVGLTLRRAKRVAGGVPAFLRLLRDLAIVGAITGLLAALVELSVRTLAPQNLRTHFLNGQSLALRDPVLGHVNRPGTRARVEGPEFSVEYRMSAQGFRDSAVYAPTKAAGTTRILVLGDSFTQGSGNHYDESWPVITERLLRRSGRDVELIKAGVFAYDTRREVLYLERLYEQYHPDIVAITFVFHDLFTNTPIGDVAATADPALASMAKKKSELHSVTLAQRMLMRNDALYSQLYLRSGRQAWFAATPGPELREHMAITQALVGRASNYCREKGCQLIMLSIPQLFQVIEEAKGHRDQNLDMTWVDRDLGDFAAQQGFSWVPMLPELAGMYRKDGVDLYHRFDGHLNGAGNNVVGAKAADVLGKAIDRRSTPDG